MSGTYNGSAHGGNDFTGEDSFSVQRNMRRQAAENIARASNGGRNKVVSADGKRVLFDPRAKRPATGKPAPAPRDVAGNGKKKRAATSRTKPLPVTSGPGRPGGSPSLGIYTPGISGSSGEPLIPTSGPGKPATVYAPGPRVTNGPGSSGAKSGGTPGTGPGNWYVGPPIKTSAGDGGDEATSVSIGGVWTQPHPAFSNVENYEKRYGDDGPVVWGAGIVVLGADMYNTGAKHLEAYGPSEVEKYLDRYGLNTNGQNKVPGFARPASGQYGGGGF